MPGRLPDGEDERASADQLIGTLLRYSDTLY
jgi:hypothetical protein